jgi:cytochrome c-type biogenesis protein CcmF
MILGTLCLGAILFAAIAGAFYYFMAARGQKELLGYGRWAVYGLAAAATVASAYLLSLILGHQYAVSYVANYTSNSLPALYLFSAFWAGQEGSFLLWVLLASWMSVALVLRGDRFEPQVMVSVLAVQAALAVMLLASSPFSLLSVVPADGAGMNPLLQNPWMAIHPPILFVGYAGLVIPFAYAIAALWKRDYSGWTDVAWPWTLFSWLFLGAGIAIGAFWAYETLGWGGYWGWDPVENSSLVPWLTATALAHGLITQKSRGTLVRWNLFLAPITFALVLYATYLTRSGVLSETSVHSFNDTGLGPFLVGVVVVSVAVTLWLLATRLKDIPDPTIFENYISRDFAMVLTVLVVLVLATAVLIGTSAPIVLHAAVGASFYNAASSTLSLILAIILSFCPLLAWRESDLRKLARGVAAPALVGVAALVIALILGVTHPVSLSVVGFGFFAASMNVAMIVRIYKAGIWKLGGYLAHVGVGLILVGIVGSAAYSQTDQLRLNQGQTGQALGYAFTFDGLRMAEGADRAVLTLTAKRGTETFVAEPVLIAGRDGSVRNPFIQRYWNEDVYVSPGDYTPADAGGSTAKLAKGGSTQAGDFAVTFLGFDVGAHQQTGATSVSAVLQVTGTKASGIVSPTISASTAGLQPGPQVSLPGSDATVTLSAIDPDAGQITLTFEGLPGVVAPATPASASFEISRKPAINLLWLGTILLMAGTVIAVQRRRLEMAAVSAPPPAAPVQRPPSPVEVRRRRRLEERRQAGGGGS